MTEEECTACGETIIWNKLSSQWEAEPLLDFCTVSENRKHYAKIKPPEKGGIFQTMPLSWPGVGLWRGCGAVEDPVVHQAGDD